MRVANSDEVNAVIVICDRARPLDVHMRNVGRRNPVEEDEWQGASHRVPIQLQVHVAGSDGDPRTHAIAR